MNGHKFLTVGMRGFTTLSVNDEWRAPPPIPIVRDELSMMRALKVEFSAVQRGEKSCCLVIARPDLLAGVAEEEILPAVGEKFSRCLRPYDGLFTLGQDRYLISLPHIQPEDTVAVMERLRGQVAEEPLHVAGAGAIMVTASLGGTMMSSDLSLQDNIDRADQALFEAWRAGGNGVCLWSPDFDIA